MASQYNDIFHINFLKSSRFNTVKDIINDYLVPWVDPSPTASACPD